MNIAFIAHDKKKDDLVTFALAYEPVLQKHTLYSTGTTGKRMTAETSLTVHRFQSGPLGGDQQIGALVAENKMDLVIFFKDPLTAQPHEPDINALIRLCDVYSIPLATNMATAEILLSGLKRGEFAFRELLKKDEEEETGTHGA
ncbi:methylglyoxal synthase [Salisediminibacterium halotolerans]|uniref:methylglyoxal synthase n=1 Tax=Salisediminibacterium halotolerans TaxID=517425 RepID=UPI000EB4A3D2|nr:methylglyoxal synthase [Salisediminibacterium halotolerans]RLJ77919.1 methylglyoxal synthase [Actinophytocola xinjiangensis]RPE88743.1 methylglyoxal synthase [Salisediminibacterium halotolerans]TWG36896.1 methylglyoxal synthase [Salisediminibacterium halotolerans]GEL07418.1 methylglyoxal synthase [Salisediminibacterium halotolerans]